MSRFIKHMIKFGAIALVIDLVAAETARAQYGGDFNGIGASATNGSFGQRNLGGMMNSATSNGAFGQRSMGGMMNGGMNNGSFGQRELGAMMNSSRGAGTFTGSENLGQVSALNYSVNGGVANLGYQQPAFAVNNGLARQYNPAQYADTINVAFGGIYGRNRNNPRSQLAEGQDIRSRSQIPIQTSYTVAFPLAAEDSLAVARKLAGELSRLSGSYGPVRVQVEGQTAVLRGIVATEHERDLAGQVAMLEPRVSHVQNELEVASDLIPSPPQPLDTSSPAFTASGPSATPQR
jgi:BON domain